MRRRRRPNGWSARSPAARAAPPAARASARGWRRESAPANPTSAPARHEAAAGPAALWLSAAGVPVSVRHRRGRHEEPLLRRFGDRDRPARPRPAGRGRRRPLSRLLRPGARRSGDARLRRRMDPARGGLAQRRLAGASAADRRRPPRRLARGAARLGPLQGPLLRLSHRFLRQHGARHPVRALPLADPRRAHRGASPHSRLHRRAAVSRAPFALLLALLLLAASASHAQDRPPFAPARAGERIVYRGATLIDGTGAPPRPDMAVITDGDRIEGVLPAARLTPAMTRGAETVDLAGRWLLPGLIDSHQHIATPPDRRRAEALLRRDVYSGITATRIMADDLRNVAELDRAIRAGELAGPDLWYAALVAGPGFFSDPRTAAISFGYVPGQAPWAQAIAAGTDLALAIARARGTGAAALKIYSDLPPGLVRALAAEAHRQGLMVWAHFMVFPTPPGEVLAAGPDVVSHTCYGAYEVMERRPQSYRERVPVDPAPFAGGDNPVMANLFRIMREHGILLDATLRVYREGERRATPVRPAHCTLDLAARLTAQARRAGVLVSAGTDGDTSAAEPYPALFEELELLVERAGFTPLEAIRAATQVGAMTIGHGRDMGVIAPGGRADLVVLARDPVADIANLRSVLLTVKSGRRFARSDYRPIAPGEAGNDD